jgi:hypothetical protein
MSRTTARPSLLAMPWRWSVISTPVIATFALYTAGAVLDVVNVSALYVAAVVVCALIGTIAACRRADPGRFASVYAATVVLTAGVWLVWTTATTAWSMRAVTVLSCGLGLLGPLWFLARHTHYRKRFKEEDELRRRKEAAEARRWPDLLAMLGMPGIVQRDRVEHGHGCYSLRLLLPVDGKVKYATLRNKTEEIEIAASLRYGALYVERGSTAADVWLHVNEVDVLSKTIPIPRDNRPLTINDPLPLGVYEDSTQLEVPMQGRASKTVGLRGKGKSNLINVKVTGLTRCVDSVVWMIDGKGGRTARPWLQPWLEGRTHRPVIDWVATTPAEISRMLLAATAVIDHRANSGAGGDKITPTPQLPEIIILCEEVALIFGQHDVSNATNARLGLKIVQLGRSEAVSVDLVAQRGTVTMLGSGDLKSQLENTFGLGVADANDARYIFGEHQDRRRPGQARTRRNHARPSRTRHPHPARQSLVGRLRRDRRTRRHSRTQHPHRARSRRRLCRRRAFGRRLPRPVEPRTCRTPHARRPTPTRHDLPTTDRTADNRREARPRTVQADPQPAPPRRRVATGDQGSAHPYRRRPNLRRTRRRSPPHRRPTGATPTTTLRPPTRHAARLLRHPTQPRVVHGRRTARSRLPLHRSPDCRPTLRHGRDQGSRLRLDLAPGRLGGRRRTVKSIRVGHTV